MDFTPKIRLKQKPPENRNFFPYDTTNIPEDKKIKATFTGFTVEVYHEEDMKFLYENGCFGKSSHSRSAPLCTRKFPPAPSEDHPIVEEALLLDLEEAFFLFKCLNVLKIYNLQNIEMSEEEVFLEFSKIKSNFLFYFIAYRFLKYKMWIVKSGIKFGADFLLYKHGPEYDHASFTVFLTQDEMDSKFFQGVHRIAETAGKEVVFLAVVPPEDFDKSNLEKYLYNLKDFRVRKSIVRRFDYKQYINRDSV